MQVIWFLKFCNMTKSGGTIPPAPNSGGTCPPPPVIYAHAIIVMCALDMLLIQATYLLIYSSIYRRA